MKDRLLDGRMWHRGSTSMPVIEGSKLARPGSIGARSCRSRQVFQAQSLLVVLVTVLVVGMTFAGSITAQVPNPESSLSIVRFDVPDPLIVDALNSNEIEVTVRNDSPGPMGVQVDVTIEDDADSTSAITMTQDGDFLHSGATTTVRFTWTGRGGPEQTGDPFGDSVTLTARVYSNPETIAREDTQSLQRPLVIHDLRTRLITSADGHQMDPGTRWNGALTVDVENHGTVDETVTLVLIDASPGWTFTLSDDSFTLPLSDPVKRISVFIEAPFFAEPDSRGTAILRPVSAQSNAPMGQELLLESPIVLIGGKLELDVDPIIPLIDPGAEAQLSVVVHNHQNTNDTAELTFSAPGGVPTQNLFDIEVEPAEAVVIPASGAATFTVTVVAPSTALAGVYEWNVEVIANATPPVAKNPLSVEVAHLHNVAMSLATDVPEATEPGSTLVIPLLLTNQGNGVDQIRLSDNDQTPTGWVAKDLLVEVPPGDQVPVDWVLEVPSGAASQDVHLRIQAESSLNPSAKSGVTLHTVHVLPVPIASLSVPGHTRPVDAGETIVFPLELMNVGNVDGVFSLDWTINQMDPQEAWTVNGPPDQFQLSPGEGVTVDLTIAVPSTLEPHHGLELDVALVPDSHPHRQAGLLLRALPAFPDFVFEPLNPSTDPDTLYAGHNATLHLRVVNQGAGSVDQDTAVHVSFRAMQDSGPGPLIREQILAVPPLDWKPGQNRMDFQVALPLEEIDPDTAPIELHIRAVVDPQGEIVEIDPSNNELTSIRSVHRYDIRVSAPPDKTLEPGEAAAFDGESTFRIRNHGDLSQSLTVRVTPEPAWAQPVDREIELAPGASHDVSVSLRVPMWPTSEVMRVDVGAHNASLPGSHVVNTARVFVPDGDPPEISSFLVDRPVVLVGHEVEFEAVIADRSGIRQATVHIIDPNGEVTDLPLQPGEEESRFNATVRFIETGDYQAYLTVQDNATARNSVDTFSDPLHFSVRTAQGPRIQVVTPEEGAYVRPGTVLVYTILGNTPIERIGYEVAGVTRESSSVSPVQISTEGWDEGYTMVTIFVEDTFGGRSNVTHNLTIDGTAPRITEISIDPPQPSPGDRMHVTAAVHDDSPVESAFVRLERIDGRSTDYPMEPGEGDLWTVSLDLPPGITGVFIIATDKAGNQGLQEFAPGWVDSGLDENTIPGPAAFLLVLIIGAVFCLGRLRREEEAE